MYYIGIIWYLKEGVLIILNEQYIKFFISQAIELTKKDKIEFHDNYEKNLETIRILRRKYGITHDDVIDEVKDLILNLKIEDYYQGPDNDDNPDRNYIFWKFGKKLFGSEELYIKLQIEEVKEEKLVCWSFHYPERPIKYPKKVEG